MIIIPLQPLVHTMSGKFHYNSSNNIIFECDILKLSSWKFWNLFKEPQALLNPIHNFVKYYFVSRYFEWVRQAALQSYEGLSMEHLQQKDPQSLFMIYPLLRDSMRQNKTTAFIIFLLLIEMGYLATGTNLHKGFALSESRNYQLAWQLTNSKSNHA